MNTQAQVLANRFRILVARSKNFTMNEEMECLLVLIYMLNRDNASNKKRYEGLTDEQIVHTVIHDLEAESTQFRKIEKETKDEYLRFSAQHNLKLNTRMRGLVRRYLHN